MLALPLKGRELFRSVSELVRPPFLMSPLPRREGTKGRGNSLLRQPFSPPPWPSPVEGEGTVLIPRQGGGNGYVGAPLEGEGTFS